MNLLHKSNLLIKFSGFLGSLLSTWESILANRNRRLTGAPELPPFRIAISSLQADIYLEENIV